LKAIDEPVGLTADLLIEDVHGAVVLRVPEDRARPGKDEAGLQNLALNLAGITAVNGFHIDERSAELLFRHKVMRMLQDEGLLSEERTELLLSWRHTGFSVHNRVTVEPEDQPAVERLARYIMRPPISLERMWWDGEGEVRYRRKRGHEDPALRLDPVEGGEPSRTDRDETRDGRALRRSWAQLIKRIYEVDPLGLTAARTARMWSGVVAQQPPIIWAPISFQPIAASA
jgi:hypothetical protein